MAEASDRIASLVGEYLDTHPDFIFPSSGNRHLCVLALTTEMMPWLIEQFGGLEDYWTTMLTAAQEWFRPDMPDVRNTVEFIYFCYCFEKPACFGYAAPWYRELSENYRAWRLSVRRAGPSQREIP